MSVRIFVVGGSIIVGKPPTTNPCTQHARASQSTFIAGLRFRIRLQLKSMDRIRQPYHASNTLHTSELHEASRETTELAKRPDTSGCHNQVDFARVGFPFRSVHNTWNGIEMRRIRRSTRLRPTS